MERVELRHKKEVKFLKESVSIRLDVALLKRIDRYAKSRKISRTQAIKTMLENTYVVQLNEGAEILNKLHLVECSLSKSNLSNQEKTNLERVCIRLWQLLNLIIEKIQ